MTTLRWLWHMPLPVFVVLFTALLIWCNRCDRRAGRS